MIDQTEREQFITQAERTFTLPRPQLSAPTKLMAGLVMVGLAALGIAAFTAFNEVMPWAQALFAAALIEAALVSPFTGLIQARTMIGEANRKVRMYPNGERRKR